MHYRTFRRLSITLLILCPLLVFSQNSRIISVEPYHPGDSVWDYASSVNPDLSQKLQGVDYFKISYKSDNNTVIAYLAKPKASIKYPCIIANRGGNREFGSWNSYGIAFRLGRMAEWGYTVIASQYRGNDGGTGQEEFGGKEINDVLNLVDVLGELGYADTSKIGMYGGSRGGMMTYLSLKKSCQFKAAAVIAGAANSFANISSRPEMETHVYAELVPDYWNNKTEELKKRSAVYWADEMCKTTPLLLMHGSSDWRVPPRESMELVDSLMKYKHPTRFILYEGADHGLSEFRNESYEMIKDFFQAYLKEEKQLPNMDPHGR